MPADDGLARRVRNASYELATALVEAEQMDVPLKLRRKLATLAKNASDVAYDLDQIGRASH